jgi:predicted phage-related endonuclease
MQRVLFTTLQNCKQMKDRSKTIGASEIGAILGVNPYMTPVDVWMVKTLRKPEFAGNEATERGLILEPAIASWFAKQSKYKIDASQVRQFASRYCSATPDFTYEFDDANKGKIFGLLETKSTAAWINDSENIPEYWFLQGVFQCAVVGNVTEFTIAYLCGGLNFGAETYAYDDEFGQKLLQYADEWYERHVIHDVQPEPRSAEDVEKLYKQTTQGIEAGKQVQRLLKQMKDLKIDIAEKDSHYQQLKSQVMLIMRDAEAITVDGKPLCTWKFSKPTTAFDAARLKEEMPEIYEKYQREKEPNRVFLLK